MEKLVKHACTWGREAKLQCILIFLSLNIKVLKHIYLWGQGVAVDILFSFLMACLPRVPLRLHYLKSCKYESMIWTSWLGAALFLTDKQDSILLERSSSSRIDFYRHMSLIVTASDIEAYFFLVHLSKVGESNDLVHMDPIIL